MIAISLDLYDRIDERTKAILLLKHIIREVLNGPSFIWNAILTNIFKSDEFRAIITIYW